MRLWSGSKVSHGVIYMKLEQVALAIFGEDKAFPSGVMDIDPNERFGFTGHFNIRGNQFADQQIQGARQMVREINSGY
ncbi:hypothetical protein PSEMO_06210 [Pseudomonas putida]|uniref:Uncharacterized protein n=1 Tax=Pseudomonas putida TaxID=303 RepID=A0A1Q9RAB6_PSEPU|nr:hypothetical protein PSEMO_06210 [Pseudomonas putida]